MHAVQWLVGIFSLRTLHTTCHFKTEVSSTSPSSPKRTATIIPDTHEQGSVDDIAQGNQIANLVPSFGICLILSSQCFSVWVSWNVVGWNRAEKSMQK
jgi:hypothetical protein